MIRNEDYEAIRILHLAREAQPFDNQGNEVALILGAAIIHLMKTRRYWEVKTWP